MATNEEEKPVNKLLALLAAVVLGSAGSSIGLRVIDDPRPDPFTGNAARELKEDILNQIKDGNNELQRRMGRLESRMQVLERTSEDWKLQSQSNKDKIDYHMQKHP